MKIGRVVKVFNDNNRNDSLFNVHSIRRFPVSFYYPEEKRSNDNNENKYIDLFEPSKYKALELFKQLGLSSDLLESIPAHFQDNAQVVNMEGRFPVILYSPGLGLDRDMYQFTISQLVSSGYVVVTIGATYDTAFTVFPDGEVIRQSSIVSEIAPDNFKALKDLLHVRVQDILYVIEQITQEIGIPDMLRGRLDIEKLGAVGHSLGGAAVLEVAKIEERLKAVVCHDGSLHLLSEKVIVDVPALLMRQQAASLGEMKKQMNENVSIAYAEGQRNLFNKSNKECRFVKINEANHMTFSDIPLLITSNHKEKQISIQNIIAHATTLFFNQSLLRKDISENIVMQHGVREINGEGECTE